MKKRALFISVLTAALCIAGFGAYAQDHMTRLDASAFEKPSRPPAVFEHDGHNEKAGVDQCHECHHVYEDGVKNPDESSEDQGCAECHPLKKSPEKTALRRAWHLRCRGCHTKSEKGPVMCGECHIKLN